MLRNLSAYKEEVSDDSKTLLGRLYVTRAHIQDGRGMVIGGLKGFVDDVWPGVESAPQTLQGSVLDILPTLFLHILEYRV